MQTAGKVCVSSWWGLFQTIYISGRKGTVGKWDTELEHRREVPDRSACESPTSRLIEMMKGREEESSGDLDIVWAEEGEVGEEEGILER